MRPVADADLDAIFDWERDADAVRMAAFTRADPADRPAFDEHYRRIRADANVVNRVIELDGDAVGTIGSFTVDGDRELTYWIAPRLWGRGIATAAVRAFLAQEEPLRPLFGRVAEGNPGSARVLEKNGFVRVGRETSYAAGIAADVVESIYRLD